MAKLPAAMLDLETLDTEDSAIVLTCGAVLFDPYTLQPPHSPEYWRITIEDQSAMGRTISESTITWWADQPEAAAEALSEVGRITALEFAAQLNKFLVRAGRVWAQGPLFDINILAHLYKQLGQPVPWQYWDIRDSRTIGDMGDYSAKKNNKAAHNALADAYLQAVGVQNIFKELGVKRP